MKKFVSLFLSAVLVFSLFGIETSALKYNSISARAALLMNADSSEVIYGQNIDAKLPMASTTKIMTTILTLESGDLDTEFVVPDEALKTEGSSMYLHEGEMVTKLELCYGMMLPSGNDAANAAALTLGGSYEEFAEMMNEKASEIGMLNTNFVTPSGLHDENHYSTAYDMAILTEYALENEDFRKICGTKNVRLSSENWEYDKYLSNSNKLLDRYESCIGVKTGFTDEAGRCLISAAEKDGVTLIALTFHASDDWNDHTRMLDYGFSVTKSVEISNYTKSYSCNVVGGEKNTISCRTEYVPEIAVTNGVFPEISEEIHLSDFVYAPIKSGDKIGYVSYFIGDKNILSVDILSSEDVNYKNTPVKISFYDMILGWFKNFIVKIE